ncbi:1917_t:CDS:2 [Entrophospora sp. SA101]|nr:1917_t:CDS:2 [Entrophospora sp. SA101]
MIYSKAKLCALQIALSTGYFFADMFDFLIKNIFMDSPGIWFHHILVTAVFISSTLSCKYFPYLTATLLVEIDSSNWKTKPKQNDTNQDTLKSKANDNNNNNNGISSSTKPKSKTKTKPAIKDSQSDQNNKPASKPAKNKSHQNNYNIPFIPPEFDSTPYWNQSSSPLPSSPSSSPPPTDDEVEIDDSPAVEKTPRRVDKHERGERLLTINVELEKDCSQTIYVHVNDDPADLAKDFCDLWKITNTAVVPELEKLIREEREKTVLSNRRKLYK